MKNRRTILTLILVLSLPSLAIGRTQKNHAMVLLDRIDQAATLDNPSHACASYRKILEDPALDSVDAEMQLDIIDIIKQQLRLRFGIRSSLDKVPHSSEREKLFMLLDKLDAHAHIQIEKKDLSPDQSSEALAKGEKKEKQKASRKKRVPIIPLPTPVFLSPFEKVKRFCQEKKGLLIAGGLGALGWLTWKRLRGNSESSEPSSSDQLQTISSSPNAPNNALHDSRDVITSPSRSDDTLNSEPEIPPLEHAQATALTYATAIISHSTQEYDSEAVMGEVNQRIAQLSEEDARNDDLVEHEVTKILKEHTENPVTIVDENGFENMVSGNIIQRSDFFQRRAKSDVGSDRRTEPIPSEYVNKKAVRTISDCLSAFKESAARRSNEPRIGRTSRIMQDIANTDLPLNELHHEIVETIDLLQLDQETQDIMWPLLARTYVQEFGKADDRTKNEAYENMDEWAAPKAFVDEIRRQHFYEYGTYPGLSNYDSKSLHKKYLPDPRKMIENYWLAEECKGIVEAQEAPEVGEDGPCFENLCGLHNEFTRALRALLFPLSPGGHQRDQRIRAGAVKRKEETTLRWKHQHPSEYELDGFCWYNSHSCHTNYIRINTSPHNGGSYFIKTLGNELRMRFYREDTTLETREGVDAFIKRFEDSPAYVGILPQLANRNLSRYCSLRLNKLFLRNSAKRIIVTDGEFKEEGLRFCCDEFVHASDERTLQIIKHNMERIQRGKELQPGFIDYMNHHLHLTGLNHCGLEGYFPGCGAHCNKRVATYKLILELRKRNRAPEIADQLNELINDGSPPPDQDSSYLFWFEPERLGLQ